MAALTNLHVSNFTPTILTYLLLLIITTTATTPVAAINITDLLSPYPELSAFSALISSTSSAVNSDLSHRSSITILAVPNSYLTSSTVEFTRHLSPSSLTDLLRYHVLLQYFSWSDLRKLPSSGILVATLFQTTGRAASDFGSVNISRNPTNTITIHSPAPYSPSNATVLDLVKTLPYNITILSINSLLVPYGFDLMASETRPALNLNITKALIDGHNFNVAASMLAASGVIDEFLADEGGAGLTLFVPTDLAFADLPNTVKLQSLPADKKAVVLKFHVLHSYYPLGSLESIVNPVQPTLATEDMGAGRFTLNISRVNGSVAIDSGLVQASVTQTVFDQNPLAIFGVSKVLLPKELFGKESAVTTKPGNQEMGNAQTPDVSPSPENSPGLVGPSSHLTSPPDFGEDIRSDADGLRSSCIIAALCCTGLLYVLV